MNRLQLHAAAALAALVLAAPASAAQIDLAGPTGSGEFGKRLSLLPNGNFFVTDPLFDAPDGTVDVGAVHLYRPDGSLIYTLRGSSSADQVGSGFVTVLANGHFIVTSPDWDNGGVFDAGAATWCNGSSGSNMIVSANNSLVGGAASNRVGSHAVALSNGHYVIISYEWDSASIIDAGAVTWGNGATGTSGVVSASNSLVGSSDGDQVGWGYVWALTNGNYVVSSPKWDDGGIVDAGAATWGNGNSGIVGTIDAGNSFVGSSAGDEVSGSVDALANGHYVVRSYAWDNGGIADAGAVTWGNGATGSSGVVGSANSLIGSSANDRVGGYLHALRNGHFVINSPDWDNGGIVDAGASTWINGTTGAIGALSAGNSLIGGANHRVGAVQVTELAGGDYVVDSPFWDNGGIVDAGASTRRSGNGSSAGIVSASNSLVGSSANDKVGNYGPCGYGSTALANGHYVVRSSEWDNGAVANVGAATWRNGAGGSGAVVSAANSLIGSTVNDQVGCSAVVALSNGHYVVNSPNWDNAANAGVGAVTWRNGNDGAGAVVSLSNSLIGGNVNDGVGVGTTALVNGNYAVRSYNWRNGTVMRAGALTWGNGTSGTTGLVNAFNSLVGTQAQDYIGIGVIFAQDNGTYIGYHPYWHNGALEDAGAISLSFGDGSTVGAITATNSVRGTVAEGGGRMNYVYDALRAQLIVGRPASNIVSLLRPGAVTSATIVLDTPDPSALGGVVTIVTTVVATPAPSAGSVRVSADTGETCTDATPTVTSVSTSQFSCQLVFASLGERSLRAEFLGTQAHGYSASGVEPHNVDILFRNGFE